MCGVPDSRLARDKIYLFAENIENKYANRFCSELREKTFQSMGVYIDAVIPMERLPRTESGKLQRVVLKDMVYEKNVLLEKDFRVNEEAIYTASDTERKLIKICRECVLEDSNATISRKDAFMDLGLDSVKLVSFAEKINAEFLKKITITDVFANSTIAEMAKFLDYNVSMEMPEVKFKDFHKVKSVGNCNGYIRFEVSGCSSELQENLPEIFSDCIRVLCSKCEYSFHCMCEERGCLYRYDYDGNNLCKSGNMSLCDLVTAKCCDVKSYKCVLFDSELNHTNYNMKHDYDIVIEYVMHDDRTVFYCYRSTYAEEKLLLMIIDELTQKIGMYVKGELVYA